ALTTSRHRPRAAPGRRLLCLARQWLSDDRPPGRGDDTLNVLSHIFWAFESRTPRGPRNSRLTAESTALYQGPTRGARYGTQIPATVRCVRDTGARRDRHRLR